MKLHELLDLLDEKEGIEIRNKETGEQIYCGKVGNCPWRIAKSAEIQSIESLPHSVTSNIGLRLHTSM